MATSMTYSDIQPEYPSLEQDGDYDADSKPLSSTEVNNLVSDVDDLMEAAYGDSTQTVKDVVIKFIVGRHIIALKRFLQEQGRDTIEPGDVPPQVDYSIPDLMKDALEGSKGADYPRISAMKVR